MWTFEARRTLALVGFYAEGVTFHSPGSRRSRAPWEHEPAKVSTPKGLHNRSVQPLRGRRFVDPLTQGGAASPLTLGFGMKPLRGKCMKISRLKESSQET